MSYRRMMRRTKRQQVTLIARLLAVLMVTVMLIMTEFVYILVAKPGQTKAFADESTSEDVIVIPVTDGSTGESVSEDGTDDKKEGSGEEEKPVEPVVKIKITEPSGWHRKAAEVKFSAEDTVGTGDFTISSVRAKIGNTGSWTDVTDSMSVELNENCVVYVEITDTKGRTYSRNKKITCFDTGKPTLNAAVNNGSLTVETNDDESGVKAVYVNGFEFTDLTDGTLNIRMQQFDTGYEYFAIQAMDYAGNMSDTYKVKNTYYKAKDASGKDVKVLPDSAEATKPAQAVADVTEHVKTDETGNMLANLFSNALMTGGDISGNSKADEKKKALAEADREEKSGEPETVPGKGREFYTIEAKSGKVFYLVIDRKNDEEKVHFLTDITENDLLNVTEDNSSTIPQNAAFNENGDPTMESALPNNNSFLPAMEDDGLSTEDSTEAPETEEAVSADGTGDEPEKKGNPWLPKLIVIGIAAAVVLIIRTINKMVKESDGNYEEDEDPEDEDESRDDDYDPEGDVSDRFNEESESSSGKNEKEKPEGKPEENGAEAEDDNSEEDDENPED